MASLLDIRVDFSELVSLADDLKYLDATTLDEIRRDAVNEMSLIVRNKAIDDASKHLNLSSDYIESRLERYAAAQGQSARARIVSPVQGSTLQRYGTGPAQLWKPVTWSNSRIRSLGHEFGQWPGWTERTGDKSRGIPANYKADGISVAVLRGQGAKRIASAFTMPLKRGTAAGGNGIGVFQRQPGKDKPVQLYGPNVYHTFRKYIQTNEDSIATGLQDQFLAGFDRAMRRIL